MDILIFDIKGRFAHFRKFYTNSSSLTYSMPPRTTVMGIIAAVLGYERDEYYTIFSKENLNIGIRKLYKTRKIMQTLNYIRAEGPKDIINPSEHTQIPFEILTGENGAVFRVYINHSDKTIVDELERRVKERKFVYSPYLGAAPFSCSLDYVARVNGREINNEDIVQVSTAVNSKYIVPKSISIFEKELLLLKEKMPAEIFDNRVIGSVDSYIFDDNGECINLKLNNSYISVEYDNTTENISFM